MSTYLTYFCSCVKYTSFLQHLVVHNHPAPGKKRAMKSAAVTFREESVLRDGETVTRILNVKVIWFVGETTARGEMAMTVV